MFAPVPFVDVLDDLLAVLVCEVDVDVGDFVAFLGEKALEEQIHADRIDGGDAERVADRRVGRRAAPLRQDAETLCLVRDVPDDEKVAGQIHARRMMPSSYSSC